MRLLGLGDSSGFGNGCRSHVIFPRTNAHFLRSLCRVRRALAQERRPGDPAPRRVESCTYAELRHMAESVGAWLGKNGFQSGARVVILADNHPRWVAVFLGVVASGCTAVPLDTALHADQITTLLKDSGSSLLFCDVKHLATAREAIGSLPIKTALINPAEQPKITSADPADPPRWPISTASLPRARAASSLPRSRRMLSLPCSTPPARLPIPRA